MQINLHPFDTLFVRDGKPFSMGEEVWANGIFPPPPSVVYGALRTAYFSYHLEELALAGKKGDPTASLEIQHLLLKKNGEHYFPCPYDLIEEKEGKAIGLLDFVASPMISSCLTPFSLRAKKPVKTLGGDSFIKLNTLEEYLTDGEVPTKSNVATLSQFTKKESKIGIQKSRFTGSAAEGRLYRVEMFRPENGVSLEVSFDHFPELSPTGLLKIGGEGKAVSYTEGHSSLTLEKPEPNSNRFKLYLATPAVFQDGWLPGTPIGEDPLIRMINEVPVRILAAAVGRSMPVGGFDVAKGKPKPMLKAVPAGSVYYLEAIEEVSLAVAKLHQAKISDFGLAKQGYGLSFTGIISQE